MLFCTSEYVFFLAAVVVLYWLTPWAQGRVWFLLGASMWFYASWNQWLAILVFGTSILDYLIARGMDSSEDHPTRRALLLCSLAMNIGLLFYFKYVNFFLESLEETLTALGANYSIPTLRVILPIGISFYTFEAINYTVDVYRRKIPAERNLSHFLLFILFFPHLVAGPIVRARDFLPQIRRAKQWQWSRMSLGLGLILLGAFKKLVIADRMGLIADPIFAEPTAYSSAANWYATIAFTIQIFCDFSGYSDMALGSAHLLGYQLAKNFQMPFLAINIAEFWRRWHISLSTWLRDYIYIPLGGSRISTLMTYRNLLLTMAIGGLWHGASWTFVVWGILQGLLLIGHRLVVQVMNWLSVGHATKRTPFGWLWRVALTFLITCLSFVIFRAEDITTATHIFQRLVFSFEGNDIPLQAASFWSCVGLMVIGHALGCWWEKLGLRRVRLWRSLPAPMVGILAALFLLLTIMLAPGSSQSFIYFQF
jgi:alginate O-acetyltransferase complex protein AlgI